MLSGKHHGLQDLQTKQNKLTKTCTPVSYIIYAESVTYHMTYSHHCRHDATSKDARSKESEDRVDHIISEPGHEHFRHIRPALRLQNQRVIVLIL